MPDKLKIADDQERLDALSRWCAIADPADPADPTAAIADLLDDVQCYKRKLATRYWEGIRAENEKLRTQLHDCARDVHGLRAPYNEALIATALRQAIGDEAKGTPWIYETTAGLETVVGFLVQVNEAEPDDPRRAIRLAKVLATTDLETDLPAATVLADMSDTFRSIYPIALIRASPEPTGPVPAAEIIEAFAFFLARSTNAMSAVEAAT